MLALSFTIQYIFLFQEFCPRYSDIDERTMCYQEMSAIFALLILANTLVDVAMWRACRTFYLEEGSNDNEK